MRPNQVMQNDAYLSHKSTAARSVTYFQTRGLNDERESRANCAYLRTCACADQPEERVASEEVPG